MRITRNTIWPRTEDTLNPIGEALIEIPSVTVAEYCTLNLGKFFSNCPFDEFSWFYDRTEWITLNRGKKFVAEIYEVVNEHWTRPWVYEMIAKYRGRKLLGIIGAMAFIVQENEKFWQMVPQRLWCLAPNYHVDVLGIHRPEKEDDRDEEPRISRIYWQHIIGSLTVGDSVIFYRDAN